MSDDTIMLKIRRITTDEIDLNKLPQKDRNKLAKRFLKDVRIYMLGSTISVFHEPSVFSIKDKLTDVIEDEISYLTDPKFEDDNRINSRKYLKQLQRDLIKSLKLVEVELEKITSK